MIYQEPEVRDMHREEIERLRKKVIDLNLELTRTYDERDECYAENERLKSETAALLTQYCNEKDALRAEVERLTELRKNAMQAASETHRSWKHRCFAITAALDADYGDPDFEMPDEINRAESAERKLAMVAEVLRGIAAAQDLSRVTDAARRALAALEAKDGETL